MSDSKSFSQFVESLSMAEELINLEKVYHDPPLQEEQKAVEGLRGGAAILMVAAFENFLRRSFEEQLSKLIVHPPITPDKLPEKMRVNCVFFTLEQAMKGPPYHKSSKLQRLNDIDKACRMLIYQSVNPTIFSDTGSNPNAERVKEVFANVGIENVFMTIQRKFENQWSVNYIAHTFIKDKLNEIINRRHVVAHTANALNIPNSDLNESLKFLKILASLLDQELREHIEAILKKHIEG